MSQDSTASPKALNSFALGLSSFLLCALTGLPAVVLGFLGLRDIRRSHQKLRGRGFALGGIVAGVMGTSLGTALAVIGGLRIQDAVDRTH
jgi:hypothetical protein